MFDDDSLLQVNAIRMALQRPVRSGDSVVLIVHYTANLKDSGSDFR